MDAAIRQLHSPPIPRQTQIDLFNGRASFAAITAWRFGWRSPPRWAADLLRAKLRARAAELLAAESAIEYRGPSQGVRGAKTLAVWRERKAREKEKAAETAALHRTPDNEA